MIHLTKIFIVIFILGVVGLSLFFILNGKKSSTQTASKPIPSSTSQKSSIASKTSPKVTTVSNQPPIQSQTYTINLKSRNSSESGTAKITEFDSHAIFKINLVNQPKNTRQPIFVQSGNCLKPGDIKYTLISLENNQSTTALNYSLGHVILDFPLSIAVYKSLQDPTTLVSCGEITLSN